MLRTILIGASAATGLAGAVLAIGGSLVPGLYLLFIGATVFLATLFERWRYRTSHQVDGAHWVRTGERFEDPSSHQIVEVFFDPRSGERRYVTPRSAARDRAD